MDPTKPQVTPNLEGQGEVDAPKYVTEEQLNRAISARLGDFSKKIEKSLGETIASSFSAKFDELKASLATQPEEKSKEASKGADIDNHPKVKGLEKQIQDLVAKTKQAEETAAAERARAKEQALRSRLTDELTKGGLDPRYVRQAVGVLVDSEKRIRFAEDDSDDLVFKDATGDVDLSTGLKSWLKSDDAKIYMPPRGVSGSGDRGDGRTPKPPKAGEIQRGDIGRALLAEFGAGTD